MITLVVPFIDAFDKLTRCLDVAVDNAGSKDWQLLLIDNGSLKPFDYSRWVGRIPNIEYIRFEDNIGVLPTYEIGLASAGTSIIAFIHSDVLLHGEAWVLRIKRAFKNDDQLGLLGLFGARGIGVDGGRAWSMGNMQGKEWGACDCHELAAWHHGEPISGIQPAVVLDGVGMFFRSSTLFELASQTDAFANWRAPHHFYDKMLSLKTLRQGYRVAVSDIEFDHFSGATANHSKSYDEYAKRWAKQFGYYLPGEDGDRMVYLAAETQFFEEFNGKLPVNVVGNYRYEWNRQ